MVSETFDIEAMAKISVNDARVGQVVMWRATKRHDFERCIVVEDKTADLNVIRVMCYEPWSVLAAKVGMALFYVSDREGCIVSPVIDQPDVQVRVEVRPDDEYVHYMARTPQGQICIAAGCRFFTSLEDALVHWAHRKRYFYDDHENKALNDWSIDFARRAWDNLREPDLKWWQKLLQSFGFVDLPFAHFWS